MGRAWPAKDMAPLIALIADPRHTLAEDGTYRLSGEQARAILDLRLQRLTALGRDEIAEELDKLATEIADYLDILASRERILGIVRTEMLAIKDEFNTPRRSEIVEGVGDLEDEDLIQREEMVVTVSHAGYVKRVPLSTYRAQRRGGKGRSGMQTRDEDFVTRLFVASTHAPVLFFSSKGKVYKLKVGACPPPPRRRAARRSSISCRWSRTSGSPPSCPCPRRRMRKAASRSCSPPRAHRAAQCSGGLLAGEPQRQDRHEAGRGRRHRLGPALHGG